MRRLCFILMLQIICVQLSHTREVTHEDIRDAMLSLVHMFRTSEDKLERHEFREKALGEQLKKALAGLDKRHRALDPLKGAVSRLDERLSNVETILIQKEEQEKVQAQNITDSMNSIQATLQILSTSLVNILRTELKAFGVPASKNDIATADFNSKIAALEQLVTKKIDAVSSNVDGLKKNISQLKEDITREISNSGCKQSDLDSSQFSRHMAETEKLLTRYETKLLEYDSNITRIQTEIIPLGEVSLADEAWHNKMTTALENQEKSIRDIKKSLLNTEELLKDLPGKPTVANIVNKTMTIMQEMRYEITSNSDKGMMKVGAQLEDLSKKLETGHDDITKTITDSNAMTENVYAEIGKNAESLRNEVQSLSKLEKVIIQTSDVVMDTKRRVEYGLQQVVSELGTMVRGHMRDLNGTVYRRFDDIESSIVDSQTGALTNLSLKIEQEMLQVWRQIGIMNQEMTASNTVLDRLQQQTEQYVNGTINTMDSMEGKVGMITTRMTEVDQNLNYLLGRLSLVTQEFNKIKLGLGDALDNIRASFLTVQAKIQDAGPGPHNITSQENDANS